MRGNSVRLASLEADNFRFARRPTIIRPRAMLFSAQVCDSFRGNGKYMAETACLPGTAIRDKRVSDAPRHSLLVRITHWLNAISFIALAVKRNRDNSRTSAVLLGQDRWTRGTIGARFTAALPSGWTFRMGTVPAFSSGMALRADGIALCNFGTRFATLLEEPFAGEGTAFLELSFR